MTKKNTKKTARSMTKPELVKQVRELTCKVYSAQRRAIEATLRRDIIRALRWTDDVAADVRKPTEPGVLVHAWLVLHVPPYAEPVWVTSTYCGYGHPKTIEEASADEDARLGYHSFMYSTEAKALLAQRHRMLEEVAFKLLGLDERLERLSQ